jgi:peptidoglycan/LPS O-acetylase OafA/YrhL
MDKKWATDNLQTIRTLMERSALYRRALAPIMSFAGVVGILAAIAGVLLPIQTEPAFIGYWLGVAIVGLVGAFALVRRQALKSSERFWSPPTRRVATALLPCLTTGLLLAIWFFVVCSRRAAGNPPTEMAEDRQMIIGLVAIWAILYGCALHAAGFYTLRGIRLLGWFFVAGGFVILFGMLVGHQQDFSVRSWQMAHGIMGGLFGLLQLAYGIYLFFTEQRGNAE